MAKLAGTYPGDWSFNVGGSYEEYQQRTDAMFAKIEDQVIGFPVADGKALYFVKSVQPPVLQHVPLGDAYSIPAAHLRGLRAVDIENLLNNARAIRALFSRRGK